MKRALVFSALGRGSGCVLRARGLAQGLRQHGWEAQAVEPFFKNLPFALESFLSIPWFLIVAAIKRPDLAVGIKPYPNCALALILVRLAGGRVVCDVDDMDWGWRGGLASLLGRIAVWPAFAFLKLFSTHHPGIQKALSRGKGFSQTWLPLKQGLRSELFQKKGAKGDYLLFTAHLNIACQLDVLMEWIRPLLGLKGVPKLVIAGGGPLYRAWKERYAAVGVEFTGPLAHEEAAQWVRGARVCLSAYSGGEANAYRVPMKVYEYLAAGKAVLTNLIPGLLELKPYLYFCKDGASFRAQLRGLLARGGDDREARGRKFVLAKRSWKAVSGEFLRALN